MPIPVNIHLADIGGSLNEGEVSSAINDNEAAEISNFYQKGKRLRRRKGLDTVVDDASGFYPTALFAFKKAVGDWELMVPHRTGLARNGGGMLVTVPVVDSNTYVSSDLPWWVIQYRDTMYLARRGTGTLKRAGSDYIKDAGVAASTTTPSIADGGAGGSVSAGSYYCVVTGYDPTTDYETDPTPVSAVLTLGSGSRKITYSSLPSFSASQITKLRLYRTLKDQTGEYFLDTTIDSSLTTYTSEKGDADLGKRASFSNGLPPASVEMIVTWDERAFISDGVDLFFSQYGLMEAYSPNDYIQVFPDDGHRIRALHAFGDRLIIGKTNKIHYLVSTGSSFNLLTLYDRGGCKAGHSMKSAENIIIWWGGDNFYGSDGTNVAALSDPFIDRIIGRINKDAEEQIVAGIWKERGWYLAAVPVDGSTVPNLLLVYNYREKKWSTFNYGSTYKAPRFIGDFFADNYGDLLYGIFADDLIYDMNGGSTDNGSAISCVWKSKQFGAGAGWLFKTTRIGQIRVTSGDDEDPSVVAQLTLKLYLDGASTAHNTRTVDLNTSRPWKRFNLSSLGRKFTGMQIGIEYSGVPEIDVSELLVGPALHGQATRPQ